MPNFASRWLHALWKKPKPTMKVRMRMSKARVKAQSLPRMGVRQVRTSAAAVAAPANDAQVAKRQ
jgi:hypothetical protein